MVFSMTGYGKSSVASDKWQITIEIKSVNSRYLETVIRMPKIFVSLEEQMKRQVQEKIGRGRVDVFVSFEEIGEKTRRVVVDKELALAYYNAMKEIAVATNLQENIDLQEISAYNGVLAVEKEESDITEIAPLMTDALTIALDGLYAMRLQEGEKLAVDIKGRLVTLFSLTQLIAERSPIVVSEYKEKLTKRISELLGDFSLDESKLAGEVAFFADKASITEELVRLESHFSQMQNILDGNISEGRKMDFIVQEMNREINTIGSKANDLVIGKLVIDAKSELEKIREQIQNFE